MTDNSGGRECEEEKAGPAVARVSPVTQTTAPATALATSPGGTKLSPPPSYKAAVYESGHRSGEGAVPGEGERETWDKKIEFLLAVVGFAVDLGNVWRFPYVCYANGGGAFLVPYFIMLIFGGLPLFYMELCLGQFHRCGCLSLWEKICPMLKGIGYAICVIDIYVGMFYNTVIGWAVYYFVQAFLSAAQFTYSDEVNSLPWTSCDNPWNSNSSCVLLSEVQGRNKTHLSSPAEEYYMRGVLEMQKSQGITELGAIKPSLALSTLAVFVLVYFALWKGVKSTGKVVWVTAIAPYIILFCLLIRGVTLDGADIGIKYYLTPQWEKLFTMKVWIAAATQIFFSLGPGFGTLLALSSYNKFNNNCYKDAIITSTINCITSFVAGFVIFSVLGYMAKMQGLNVSDVGMEGEGLVFIVYSDAIASMPGSFFWAILFFFMLITLGIDSTFGGLEAMITGLCDEFPKTLGKHRELFVLVLLGGIFLCCLPTCTYGGKDLVAMLNMFGSSTPILFVVFLETIGVFWFYGVSRFCDDVEQMIGSQPSMFWRVCWKFISPLFLFIILIFSLIDFIALDGMEHFKNSLYAKPCPSWLGFLGWCMTFSSIWLIPAYAIYLYFQQEGTPMERFTKISSPKTLLPKSLSKDANRVNIRTSQDISFKTSVNATAL